MKNKKVIKISIHNKHASKSSVIVGNGDAILDTICISCIVDEDAETGNYVLDAIFKLDDKLVNYIEEESILKVKLDYGEEYFRIAKIIKNRRDITVFARQITISETIDLWLSDVRPENQTGQGALSWILNNSEGNKDIRVFSDITTISTAYYMDMNMYQALHDCDQSFMERWGGEIQRRGYDLNINKRIGRHRGVLIHSRKNLTGFEADTNVDSLVTRIKPKGFDGITIDGFLVSPNVAKYPRVKTRVFKYEDIKVKDPEREDDEGFDTLEEAQQELIKRGLLEFTKNRLDEIQASYRINFIQLEHTEEYKNYVQAERVFIGDEIDVYEHSLKMNLTVRATRRKFDVLLQRTIEIELSNEVKKSKPPSIEDVLDKLDKFEDDVNENNTWYKDAISNATDLINNGLKDSYVITRKNEILIMDTTDINTAINVWRWNKGGLGFSRTGYYGEYDTAITQDGSIVAKFLTGLIVNGEQINAKNLNVYNKENTKTLEVTENGDVILRPNVFEILSSTTTNIPTKSELSDAIGVANSYTDTQFKLADGKIDQKVSQAEYDENNNIVGERFAQMTHTIDGFKFDIGGAIMGNLIRKSQVWEASGSYGFAGRSTDSIRSGWHTLCIYGRRFDDYSGNLVVYLYTDNWDWSVSVTISETWWVKKEITFEIPPHIAGRNIMISTYNFPSGSGGQVSIGWYCLTEGKIPPSDWIPHSEELNTGVTHIDREGVRVDHEGGNFSQMTSQGFKRHRSNGDLQGDYHYLMYQGTVYCNSEQYVRVNLPSDFHHKKINAVASAACIGTGNDAWEKPEPLVSFWAEVNRIADDSSWVEFYASTRQNRDGSILTQHKGIKFAYWITA